MMMTRKYERRYYLHRVCRKKGENLDTKTKTFTRAMDDDRPLPSQVRCLMRKYGYAVQLTILQ